MRRILLVFALYIEAKPFIHCLNLKPRNAPGSLQIFVNDQYACIITGTGKSASACGTAYLLSQYPESRICLNIGICGGSRGNQGKLFLIDQILDQDAGRAFYPDCWFTRNLSTGSLTTVSRPINLKIKTTELFDLEGSGFFEAAANFLAADQIQILKIVSDTGQENFLNKKEVERLLEKYLSVILDFVQKKVDSSCFENDAALTESELKYFGKIASRYALTVTQKHQLQNLWQNLKVQTNETWPAIYNKLNIVFTEKKSPKEQGKEFLKKMQLMNESL